MGKLKGLVKVAKKIAGLEVWPTNEEVMRICDPYSKIAHKWDAYVKSVGWDKIATLDKAERRVLRNIVIKGFTVAEDYPIGYCLSSRIRDLKKKNINIKTDLFTRKQRCFDHFTGKNYEVRITRGKYRLV